MRITHLVPSKSISSASAGRWLLAMVDGLHVNADIGDGLWRELSGQYDEAQLVELVMLAGLYHAVSFLVNALRLEKESFAPGFPRLSGFPPARE